MLGQAPPQTPSFGLGGLGGPGDGANHIKDGTDASFAADVIEASKVQPVIVDFWATWCGPCKTLGPALEKAVAAAGGRVKLVKIDVDKNPAYAGQLRVQSIPTVYGFVGGQPVDGFMGAVPASEIQAFIDKLTVGDPGGAAQAYAQVLQLDPENLKALAGLARAYLASGDTEKAREVLDMAPEGAKDVELDSVRTALKLAAEAPSETAELDQRLAADPDDHQARFDLAAAQAGSGRLAEAIDNLLTIIAADRAWNDEAARKQLLTVFEAGGFADPAVKAGRKRLSTLLFS